MDSILLVREEKILYPDGQLGKERGEFRLAVSPQGRLQCQPTANPELEVARPVERRRLERAALDLLEIERHLVANAFLVCPRRVEAAHRHLGVVGRRCQGIAGSRKVT